MEKKRINKYISEVGFCSRRKADVLIEQARIKINGKIAVMNVSSPDGIHPHSAYAAYHSLNERVTNLVEKGAVGVLLINPEGTASDTREFFKNIRFK